MDNKPKNREDEANKRDCNYMYFIENHIETSQATIKLSKTMDGIKNLQKVKNGILDKGQNNKYEYSIYRISIYPKIIGNIKEIEVPIKLIDKNNNEFKYEIILKNFQNDIFIFNIKFVAKVGWLNNNIEPPLSFPFSNEEQFDIYVNYLRVDLKLKQYSKQNEALIQSALKFFGQDKEYNFALYLQTFLECFATKYLKNLLKVFKPERIRTVGVLDGMKSKKLCNILKHLEKKPEKVLKNINPKDKEKFGISLFGIILYFTFNFDNNRMDDLLNNKIQENKNYIDKALINYNILFKDLKLNQDNIISLIENSNNSNEINNSLAYSKDIIELLQIIISNFKKIFDIYKTETTTKSKESIPKFDINSIITPNKNDNMNELSQLYRKLLKNQKDKNLNKPFILFDDSFYEKYINYFKNSNVDNLFCIGEMIKETKDYAKNNININTIIHDTGIHLASTGKIKNIEVLNFLSKDEYYNSSYYKNIIYRSLDILKGIDISSLNDDFFEKWKKTNLNNIFSEQYNSFCQIIIDKIKDLNEFNLLFKLCDNSKNNNQPIFDLYALKLIQNKFLDLYKSYNPKIHLHLIDDLKLLLFYSDIQNANIDTFLTKNIQISLNVNLVNKIYIELLSTYGDVIKAKTKNIIVKFFLETKDNTNPESLLYIISNCPKLIKEILQNMNNFCIYKSDIFQLNETDNYKLFKGLLDLKFFEKKEYKKTQYVKNINQVLTEIGDDIEKGEINYNIISVFYDKSKPEDKLEDKLFDILKQISLNDNDKAMNYKNSIDNYYKRSKKVIDDLQLIVDDLVKFYEIKENETIEVIKNIISEIKANKLNYYDKNYTGQYKIFTEKYKKNAEERLVKLGSVFFLVIYNYIKKKIKDEDKLLSKTEETFELLKDIFTKNINQLRKDLLDICLNTIKNKTKEEIDKIIETLAKIFKIQNYDKQQIIKSMIILSRKEYVLKISYAISSFLDKIGSKGQLYKLLEKIIENLKKSSEEQTILNAINDLNSYGIKTDIVNDEKSNYLNILLKLKEQPEALSFLLKTTDDDCRSYQELVGEIDNSFININDIDDLEKCVIIKNKLGNPEELKHEKDIDIIKSFKKEVENTKDKEIEICFNKFVNNYSEIKSLVDCGLDKSEASKKKVLLLCKESKFTLTNIKNNFFKCIYKDEMFDKDNQKQIIFNELNLDNLLELRDRIQLTKKITGDKTENKLLEKYKQFIEKVSEINNIYKSLKNIYMSGYPEKIEIVIIVDEGKSTFIGCQLNTKESRDILSKLQDMLNQLKRTQLKAYKEKPLIRFIYGRHFYFLYDIVTKKEKNKNKISSFLNYISNKIKKEIDFTYESKNNNIYEDIINNCEKYLKKTLEKNDLTLEKIYKDSLIKGESKNIVDKGIFLYFCTNLEIKLYQIYKYLTKYNPEAQTVLLCNKETTSEELIAFLYRSILCDYNSCFIIGGVELLEFEKRNVFMETLKTLLYEYHKHIKSILIILYISKESDIYQSLSSLKYKKFLDNLPEEEIKKIRFDEDSKVEIISSDKSGVGKSTKIRLEIKKKKKKYIHFPFGGVFNRENIIERLKNINFSNDSILHLDLYDTEQIELMTEFLFSLLITKLYGRNEDFFYFSKDIEIKIEIPNGFIDFIKKIPILSLSSNKKLEIGKLADLIVPDEISSNIQVVANFLWLLKEDKKGKDKNITADQVDLFFENISPYSYLSPEYKSTVKYARKFSQKECQDLIFNEIKKDIKEPNYYQITSFIDILSTQFKKFNQCFYLNVNVLKERGLEKVRLFILKNFIELTKYFTKGAFNEILESQEDVHNLTYGVYKENEDINNAMKRLANNKHDIISYDKINPSLLFFHENEGQGFSFITNKFDDEYKSLCDFKNTQTNENNYKIPNYKNFKPEEFLKELKDILNINNPINDEEKNENLTLYKDKKTLKEIAGSYIFTADNFVKMVLILLRIRSNIPVIMMGETGCGKTSLIRKLSEMINNGSNEKMKILNIHAGTTDKDIISFLENNVIEEAKLLEMSENFIKEEQSLKGYIYFPKKMWVFLDEINTCKSMGLITELMCNHSYQGNPLPPNIVFIAACNPYRQGNKNIMAKAGLDPNKAYFELKNLNDKEIERLKNSMNNTLVYTVNPLPHSLLNFVFDFGNLEEEDEVRYIESIILESITKIFNENKGNLKENDLKKIHKFAKDMIVCAQNFIRKRNDVSSVSLREIRRFNIFYEFFFKYLINKKEIESHNSQIDGGEVFYKSSDMYSLQIYSVILSVFVCYYLRITDSKTRKELKDELNKILKNFDEKSREIDFLDIPLKEEQYIVDNIQLEKGIAKNRALLDNIFSLFTAINSKVPIFIVGKPGCSKSLSVQLINKSMKGSSSNSPLFRTLPRIILNSYQGSMGSTSQGVKKIFDLARKKFTNLKEEDKKNNISMIYFDEMGLAEHSPNNPLKVIHSELEYDLNEGDKKIAFVGISNWALDASKMNRGIFLSIPDPELDETKETALIIGKSYDDNLANLYKGFFESFGEIYYKYKKYLNKHYNQDGKNEFHGNRDFYHLVKIASRELIKIKNSLIDEHVLQGIAISSIERNFGGLQLHSKTSLELIKEIFKEKYENYIIRKEYEVYKRIKENINDIESRYLLVISKNSISTYLLSAILEELGMKYSFYVGSQFEDDVKSEEYTLKILNKIQLHMEQGKVLILKNLESVYPTLYDLFNQNFQEMGKKKFARIAVGSSSNAFSIVNNEFRCIVNVDESKMDEEEAPFLNRFEKHIISFECLMDLEKERNESERIYKILQELISIDKNVYKGINYDFENIFINNNIEEIQGIIYQTKKNRKKKNEKLNIQDMINVVISKISLILPQDILLCMKFNGFQSNNPEVSKQIIEEYSKGEHQNLGKFLEKLENKKNIVYTFSRVLDVIELPDSINNSQFLGEINNKGNKINIKDLKISSFKSENEFETEINEFLNNDILKVCLIRFTENESIFLNYIKFFLDNKEKELIDDNNKEKIIKKAFVLIVHLKRNFNESLVEKKKKETISHLSDYYQIFIDNLNGSNNFIVDNIFNLKGKELFEKCLDFNSVLRRNIYIGLRYMKYNFSNTIGKLNENNYVKSLVDYITNDNELMKNIHKSIFKSMEKDEDIIIQVFKKENSINQDDIDLINIIQKHLSDLYLKNLYLLYYKAEQDQFFSTLLSNLEIKNINKNKNKPENDQIIEEEEDNIIKKTEENKDDENENVQKTLEKAKNIYLEKLIIFENNEERNKKYIIEEQEKNKLDIILGLKLPGFKAIINSIIKRFRNEFMNQYRKYENTLRDDLDEYEIESKKQEYFSHIKIYNHIITIEIEKNEIISEILKENNIYIKEELFDLFLKDYYFLFIETNLKNINKENNKNDIDYESVREFLAFLVELRNNSEKEFKETDVIRNVANIINWVETYSEEITIILNIFSKLNKIISNLFEQIKKIINNNKIKYEVSERNQPYKSIVNKLIFLGIDSILKVVTSNEQIYINLKDNKEKLSQLIDINKEILQQALRIQNNLMLFSKEIYSLEEFLSLYDCFKSNKIDTSENITKLIKFFSNETCLINGEKEDELKENFNQFYKYLNDSIGKDKSFNDIMSIIFKSEYIKISYDSFKNILLETILSKNEFIYKNYQLFNLIINLESTPEEMEKNLTNIKELKDPLITTLSKHKDEFLEQAIINIFEYIILKYFNSITSLDYNKMNRENKNENRIYFKSYYQSNCEANIIFDLSFNIFRECIQILDNIYEPKDKKIENENLCKLYAISYIKIYLSKVVFFAYNNIQNIKSIHEIINEIKGSNTNSKFRNVIKIYLFKLLFNIMNRNWGEFIQFNFTSIQIDFFNILSEDNDQNESLNTLYLTKYFIPFEPKVYKNYNEEFNEYKNKNIENAQKILTNFLKKNDLDAFIMVSINQIISKLEVEINNKDYSDFSKICELLFNNYNMNNNLKQLLLLFFNEDQFKNIIKPKLEERKKKSNFSNDNPFESLLYGFRFCVQTLNNNKFLYSSILSEDCLKTIKKSFIPGNYQSQNIKDKEKNNFGINFISKDKFLLVHKKVRNLSEIGFRLLNFILYNHLFFANCLNYYTDNEFNKDFEIMEMNCLDVIKANWNLLDEALRKKNIISIEIFMNLIFKRLSELIKKCKLITKEKELNEFEEKVEKLIETCINEYPDYSEKYLEINKQLLPLKAKNIRTIISELEPPIEEIYPFEEYPFLKYFTYTEYRTLDNLIKELGPEEDYKYIHPLLFKYLSEYCNNDSDVKKLKFFPGFNNFANMMIDHYSFKISREDAKNRTLDMNIVRDFKKKYFDNFEKSWQAIKKKAIKYQSNNVMEPKNLTDKDNLVYFLNDVNENGYGMYIAAAYEKFIKWQNGFLEYIIKNSSNNKNLNYFIENMKNKIPIYQANKNQILSIDNCFDDLSIRNFDDLIYAFSRRNIYGKDGIINYLNYNSFLYDIVSIEDELGKFVLSGKCLFEDEENLNFMNYWGEGFNAGKSDILDKFYLKYKQKDLEKDKIEKIIEYIKTKRIEGKNDFKPFLGSIQLIIFYLVNNNAKENDTIQNIIISAEKYLNIDKDTFDFFNNDVKELNVENIMHIFFLFEHVCFNDIIKYLPEEYKVNIKGEIEEKIKSKLLSDNLNINDNFTITEFGAAVRRFISRYLIRKKQKVFIDLKSSLDSHLKKTDLWGEKIGKLKNLGQIISDLMKEFDLKVEQVYEFYNLIKEKDEKEISFLDEELEENIPKPVRKKKKKV